MIGKEYEHRGIAKDGAKMVSAVANSRVPRFTIIIGGSFGAGNYAMSGRAYDPTLLFMWPNARISVMGGEQAADVLTAIKQNLSPEQREEIRRPILEKYEHEGSAWYSTSRLWDDGVIDPVHTREILALSISMSLNREFDARRSRVYRM
jgi:acetyl-CoA carboxylase carboxyltransferase component